MKGLTAVVVVVVVVVTVVVLLVIFEERVDAAIVVGKNVVGSAVEALELVALLEMMVVSAAVVV